MNQEYLYIYVNAATHKLKILKLVTISGFTNFKY